MNQSASPRPDHAASTLIPGAPPSDGGAPTVVPSGASLAKDLHSQPTLRPAPAEGEPTLVPKGLADQAGEATVVTVAAASAPNRVGRYELLAKLGEGGMGEVFKARHLDTAKIVALKRIRPPKPGEPDPRQDPSFRRSFRREAERLREIRHRNIVPVLEVGETDTGDGAELYYVMEYFAGGSLAEAERRTLPADRLVEVGLKIAEALVKIGSAYGMVHRDIKPANILVRDDGEPVLADFGIVHSMTDSSINAPNTVGTPRFMAPEIARGDKGSPQSDIYSLGATLYCLAAGVRPYDGDDPLQVLEQIRSGPPVPLASLAKGLPPDLVRIIEGMMARQLRERYVEARDVVEDFKRLRKGEPIVGPRGLTSAGGPTGAEAPASARRNRAARFAVAAAVVLVAGGLAVWGIARISQRVDPYLSGGGGGIPAAVEPEAARPSGGTAESAVRRRADVGLWAELDDAIKARQIPKVQELCRRIGRQETVPDGVANPAFTAVDMGELESLRIVLASGVVSSSWLAGEERWTILHRAAGRGQAAIVDWLLSPSVGEAIPGIPLDVGIPDGNGVSPLSVAADRGQLESVRRLLAHGAKVTATDRQQRTALHWAAQHGNGELLQTLIDQGGADALGMKDAAGQTAMDVALSNSNVEAVRFFQRELIDRGRPVPGWDAAAWRKDVESQRLLP